LDGNVNSQRLSVRIGTLRNPATVRENTNFLVPIRELGYQIALSVGAAAHTPKESNPVE
jgi:hypothetical protein